MRRNRVLLIFALMLAMSLTIVWLNAVLAAATLNLNEGITVAEGSSGTIDNSMLQVDDPDSPGATVTYSLVTTPANGMLSLDGGITPLTPTAQFNQSDIDNNSLSYIHNDSETSADSFDFIAATFTDTLPQTTFLITITPVFDKTPSVLDQGFNVDENSVTGTAVGIITATDEDAGDSLAFTIVGGNFDAPFSLSITGAIAVNNPVPLDFETNQSLTFTVQVEDLGTLKDTATITVTINDVNEPPVANNATFTVPENSAVGTAVQPIGIVTATDPENDPLTFAITDGNTGGTFAINQTTGQITVTNNSLLDFEALGSPPHFTLTVEVSDGELTDEATITINVTDVNEPPVANNATFTVPENSAVGTAVQPIGIVTATDPDNDPLTFAITDGNTGGTFAIHQTTGQITVTNNSLLDFEALGSPPHFTLTVEVNDGELTDEATILINVTDVNEPPVANNATFTVPENSAVGTAVQPIGIVTATDPENDPLTFAITSGNTGGTFAIHQTTGQITVTNNSLLDFEALGSPPHFTLTVEVSDGELTDEATITINVTDVNGPPVILPQTFTVPENSAVGTAVQPIGIVTATDPDNDPLTFAITDGNTGGTFAIHQTTGQITVTNNSLLDFEALGSPPHFTLTVEVSDGELTDEATIIINVTDINLPPTVDDDTFTVPENSAVGTAVQPIGIVTATDPDNDPLTFAITDGNTGGTFAIHQTTGQITVTNNSLLNFEALGSPPHFTLTVKVDDGELTDEATITINVTDVNESPVILPQTFTILENSANGTAVGTAIATDPENQPLQYEILTLNAPFGIHPSTGSITVINSAALNYEVTPSFTLSIRVTDNGQLGDGASDPPPLSHTADITINLLNVNESPSVNNATFSVAEDSPNGTVVGTVTATDPDAGDSLTYTITGGNTPGTPFAINAGNGRITVINSALLNAATKAVYNLTISVQDSGGRSATATITINILPPATTTLFLPLLLNNYPPVEPNNHPCDSYPIGSGTAYQFTADDTEDWYIFTLPSAGNLTVTVSNFTPEDGQLVLYSGSCNNLTLLQNNGSPGTTKIISLPNRPAGTYFIRVFSDPITNTTYTLRVN